MEIIGRDERIRTSDPLTPRVWGSLPVPVYHRIGRFERRIFDVFRVHRGDRELGGRGSWASKPLASGRDQNIGSPHL